jgi:predicted amidophosphoribosyltransferase
VECGNNLNEENVNIICVCGTKNPVNSRFCSSCKKPLNPDRLIKSRIVCDCGKIMEFNSEFCPNCGKNIKKSISRKKNFSKTIKSVKDILHGV